MEWRLPGRNSRTRGSSETQLKYPLHGNTMSRGHIKCFRPAHTDLLGPAAGSQRSYADPEIELGSSCAPEPWEFPQNIKTSEQQQIRSESTCVYSSDPLYLIPIDIDKWR